MIQKSRDNFLKNKIKNFEILKNEFYVHLL